MKLIKQQIKNAAPVRAGRLLLGALGTLVLLTACGTETTNELNNTLRKAGDTILVSGSSGNTSYTTAALPSVSMAVGTFANMSDQNTKITVDVTEVDLQILKLINEVRTENTLDGAPLDKKVSCKIKTLPGLSYSGVAAYAAKGHAQYLVNTPVRLNNSNPEDSELHKQVIPNKFRTGEGLVERLNDSSEKNKLDMTRVFGEIVAVGNATPKIIVQQWLESQSHCERIFDDEFTHFGASKARNEENNSNKPNNDGRLNFPESWVVDFVTYK